MESSFILFDESKLFLMRATYCVALLSVIGAILAGGVFFAFSTFVMPALDRLPPAQAIAAINAKAINPWLMILLFGTGLLCVAGIVLALYSSMAGHWNYLMAGAALYIVGCLVVTMACNVPLNHALARIEPTNSSGQDWVRYRTAWTRWNHVRTIGCVVAAVLILAVFTRDFSFIPPPSWISSFFF
jgi:uncharacterized membrane protein